MKVDRPSLCTYITTPVTGTCPFACMDKNAMQKFQWELMDYASVLTNTSWDYFIMDYGSYQPYGQLICKTLSYRENVWGYTITIIRMTANQVIYISWMKLGQPRQNPGLQAHLVRHSQSSCLPTVSKSCTKHLTTLLCSRTYSAFEYTYFPTIYTMEKAMCQMNTVYKKYQTQNWWAAYGGTS